MRLDFLIKLIDMTRKRNYRFSHTKGVESTNFLIFICLEFLIENLKQ